MDPFNAAAALRGRITAMDMEQLMPRDLLDLQKNRFSCVLTSSDGASAEYDILADRTNGVYAARIVTHEADGDYVSEMRARAINGASGSVSYRVDALTIDNRRVDPADIGQLSNALLVFLSYKNAAFPNGEGPAVLFPRPGADPAPLPDFPNQSRAHPVPPRRSH